MRTVIVSNIMSVDGHYEGSGRNVMVLNMDEAFDHDNLERIRSVGTILLGRSSHESLSSYWQGIADAPADPEKQALSDDNRELSRSLWRLRLLAYSEGRPSGETSRPRPTPHAPGKAKFPTSTRLQRQTP